MVQSQILSGVLAIALGGVVGVLLFVPFVAISYRRRGGLTLGRVMVWAAALVYFWAIWTYTLLPLPSGEYTCVEPNLDFGTIADDLRRARAGGNFLRDFAFLQLALNVVLFLPLGFFLRVLAGRGIVVATAVGFCISLFIETTQLTGVWGLFPCAYRMFDVVDLLTNTGGAFLGSLLALLVPLTLRDTGIAPDAGQPRPVTRRRRLLAMACDLLTLTTLQVILSLATQLVLEYIVRDHEAVIAGAAGSTVGLVGSAALVLMCVLVSGRTPGDLAVQLRYAEGRLPVALARLLRFVGGVGGYAIILMLAAPWGSLGPVYVLVALVAALSTQRGRGLPGLLSGQRLTDARSAGPAGRPGSSSVL